MSSQGLQLQERLIEYDRAQPDSNFVSEIWFDMYLSDRRPVVLTHNPTIVFKDSNLGGEYNQVSRCRFH